MDTDKTKPGALVGGRFLLDAKLGRGGHATVWRARDTTNNRTVAVKLIHRSFRGQSAVLSRFQRELSVLTRLDHPHIARALDGALDTITPYFVMELVEGTSLERHLGTLAAAGKLLPIRDVVSFAVPLASALEHAHEQGVVHRDLKPANLIITTDGQPKLLDFGIAKLLSTDGAAATTQGRAIGSVAYMSPEQLAGEDVGPRSDVYALGVVLLELVTLRRAWHRDASGAALPAYVEAPRPNAFNTLDRLVERIESEARPRASELQPLLAGDVGEQLDAVFARAMSIDAADRFDRPGGLATALADIAHEALVRPVSLTGMHGDTASTNRGAGPRGTPIRTAGPSGTPIRTAGPSHVAPAESRPGHDTVTVQQRVARLVSKPTAPRPSTAPIGPHPPGDTTLTLRATLRRDRYSGAAFAIAAVVVASAIGVGVASIVRRSEPTPIDPAPAPAPVTAVPAERAPAKSLPAPFDTIEQPAPKVAPTPRARPAAAPAPPRPASALQDLLQRARSNPSDMSTLAKLSEAIVRASASIPSAPERARIQNLAQTSAALGDVEGLEAAVAAVETR